MALMHDVGPGAVARRWRRTAPFASAVRTAAAPQIDQLERQRCDDDGCHRAEPATRWHGCATLGQARRARLAVAECAVTSAVRTAGASVHRAARQAELRPTTAAIVGALDEAATLHDVGPGFATLVGRDETRRSRAPSNIGGLEKG